MPVFARIVLWAGVALTVVLPAQAQTMIDAGKSGAQLYASDCAPCHKTPRSLVKSGPRELAAFLREHYTSSRETAGVLADYLVRLAAGQGEPAQRRRGRETAPDESKAAAERVPSHPAATRARSRRGEPAQAAPAEAKPAETKPAETKPAEAKPADTARPAESKPAEPKPAEAPTPAAASPEPKRAPASEPKSEPSPAAADSKPAGPAASPAASPSTSPPASPPEKPAD